MCETSNKDQTNSKVSAVLTGQIRRMWRFSCAEKTCYMVQSASSLILSVFLSTFCLLVGSVWSVGKHNELHSRGVLLRSVVRLPLLLAGCSVRDGWQPQQPAGPDAHEVQYVVLKLQRRTAQHHTDWWVWRGESRCHVWIKKNKHASM